MDTEKIYELLDGVAKYENNAAQAPLKLLQQTTELFAPKSRALCCLIGGESVVIKAITEFNDKICIKIPRTAILRTQMANTTTVLKNLLTFRKEEKVVNISAERFSQGALLQKEVFNEVQKQSIRHFAVPAVRTVSTTPVLHYIMDWCDNPPILNWLREKADIAYNLGIFKKLLYAAHFLQQQGIVHRDWKSDNILAGEGDTVIIVDWTLAKYVGSRNLTIPGTTGGSEGYAPAKMLKDGDFQRANYSDDLSMLGFVLWEFLTNSRLPLLKVKEYTDNNILKYRRNLLEYLPECAHPIFWRATEQEECARYQTAKEFLNAIDRLADVFAQDSGWIPNETNTPILVVEDSRNCEECQACGGVEFCQHLRNFIRKNQ